MEDCLSKCFVDPANPSGRDVWWSITKGLIYWMHPSNPHPISGLSLENFIVMRAANGCPDCISAILECPDDAAIARALASEKLRPCVTK